MNRVAKWLTGALFLGASIVSGCVVDDGGGAALYERCGSNLDCTNVADACFIVTNMGSSGGMCSTYCVDDRDCLGYAGCYALADDPAGTQVCYERCAYDYDCAPGFACLDAIRGGVVVDRICLPR